MKILLDENIDRNFKKLLTEHDVYHVKDMKWLGMKNGELLSLAVATGFEIFISNDTQIKFQQNLSKFNINLIILKTRGNDLELIVPIIPELLKLITSIEKGLTKGRYFEVP